MEVFSTWPNSRYADPVPVPEGIRLLNDTETAPLNWWTDRWLQLVQRSNIGIRFERARYYASLGQVVSIQLNEGRMEGLVQGSQPEPYRVIIAMPPVDTGRWRDFLRSYLDFGMSTELFSGKLPQKLAALARECGGFDIIPDDYQSFHSKCSCPDWSNPCKHVAAVHMLVAYEIDRDPLLLLSFRGIEKREILACIKQCLTSGGETNVGLESDSSDLETDRDDLKITDDGDIDHPENSAPSQPALNTTTPEMFWEGHKLPFSTGFYDGFARTEGFAAIAESLGRFPLWRSSFDFRKTMEQAYANASAQAKRIAVL